MKIEKGQMYASADLTNADYHGTEGFFSSSTLKDMLKDPELFHAKYITKTLEMKVSAQLQSAFDIGSYFHAAVLEPDVLEKEFVIADVARRAGKEWRDAQEAAEEKGATCLTADQVKTANVLVEAVQDSPIAMELLESGEAEASLFWELMGCNVKVRADWLQLSEEESYIVDLKSTTGSVRDPHGIRKKIESLSYDLSAALYVDTINSWIEKTNQPYAKIETFYWTFASKDQGTCRTYASTELMLEVGRAKYQKALAEIKKFQDNEWEFTDEVECLDPPRWVVDEWLEDEEETQSNDLDGL